MKQIYHTFIQHDYLRDGNTARKLLIELAKKEKYNTLTVKEKGETYDFPQDVSENTINHCFFARTLAGNPPGIEVIDMAFFLLPEKGSNSIAIQAETREEGEKLKNTLVKILDALETLESS